MIYETRIGSYTCIAKKVGTAYWVTIDDTGGTYAVDDSRKVQVIPLYPDQVRHVINGGDWNIPAVNRVMKELIQESFR
jgi:hypothetical protein